jgi:hypothetical protein
VPQVDKLPYDPEYPQVCLDGTSKRPIAEVEAPWPCRPGQPSRYEAHHRREGVCQLFWWYEPLIGRRPVAVRDHKGHGAGRR